MVEKRNASESAVIIGAAIYMYTRNGSAAQICISREFTVLLLRINSLRET